MIQGQCRARIAEMRDCIAIAEKREAEASRELPKARHRLAHNQEELRSLRAKIQKRTKKIAEVDEVIHRKMDRFERVHKKIQADDELCEKLKREEMRRDEIEADLEERRSRGYNEGAARKSAHEIAARSKMQLLQEKVASHRCEFVQRRVDGLERRLQEETAGLETELALTVQRREERNDCLGAKADELAGMLRQVVLRAEDAERKAPEIEKRVRVLKQDVEAVKKDRDCVHQELSKIMNQLG